MTTFTSKQVASSTVSTPPSPIHQPRKYSPIIIQHPDRARMSGMGSTVSRRLLDPPLVLKLLPPSMAAPSPSPIANSNLSHSAICTVALLSPTSSQLQSFSDVPYPSCTSSNFTRYVDILMGQTSRNPVLLDDGSHYFVFEDLSVRIQGRFRVLCTLVDLVSGQVDTLVSKVFEVYSPQYYPGILEPTELSRWLYGQGIGVRAGLYARSVVYTKIGRASKKRSSNNSNSSSSSAHGDGDGQAPSSGPRPLKNSEGVIKLVEIADTVIVDVDAYNGGATSATTVRPSHSAFKKQKKSKSSSTSSDFEPSHSSSDM